MTALTVNYWNLQELERKQAPGPEIVLFNELGNDNAEIKTLLEALYLRLRKMLETRLIALKQLPFETDRERLAGKSRAILVSLVGSVAIAKSLPGAEERLKLLEAAQRQILVMLGVDEGELDSMLSAAD